MKLALPMIPGMRKKVALLLLLAAGVAAVISYSAISGARSPFGPDPRKITSLVLIDLVLLLAILALVSRRAASAWMSLRKGLAGSRLQTRMMVMLSLIAIVPALLVSIFSIVFFHYGIQSWFNERVSTALDESLVVAEAYFKEHQEVLRADALAMAADLNREINFLVDNPPLFNQVVTNQAMARSLSDVVVFQGNKMVAMTSLSFSFAFEKLPFHALERAERGEVVLLTNDNDDKVRALIKLDQARDTYLLISRYIESKVLDHMERTQGAYAEYNRLRANLASLESQFVLVFVVLALLILMIAIWYGMMLASQLATPITRLMRAAERVRAGDLAVRVAEGNERDEMTQLIKAFNRMTEQLETQRQELIAANRQIDARRHFTEAVLQSVSAGVLAIDQQKRLTLANEQATSFLLEEVEPHPPIAKAFPEIMPLIEEAERLNNKPAQGEIAILRGDKPMTLHVRITAEVTGKSKHGIEGFTVTFDDITALASAQRKAAWADVARRIAHEIKNPLTPIQLAAERLRGKYLKQISEEDSENYLKYLDTVSRHVGDIGRMVEEFVGFARMPAPIFAKTDLVDMVRNVLFSEEVTHPSIRYSLTADEVKPISGDASQLSQAFTNLLKNAAEALEATGREDLAIRVGLKVEEDKAVIEICDNGPGFPPDLLPRITEPYVTTRAKGTGLGLAIAKKIIEDHQGHMACENLPEGGACVRVTLPVTGKP